MKRLINKISVLSAMVAACWFTSCVTADDLATPNVASPVLVMLSGNEFEAATGVEVEGTFLELDKSGIMDHRIGIDSIPVSGLEIRVFINDTEEVGSLVTDGSGKIMFRQPWANLGIATATSGRQVRLEFAGSYKNVAFRQYHNVSVR